MNFYDQVCREFEDFLNQSAPKVTGFHPHFQKAFWEMLECGGKRFRPKLLFCVVCSLNPMLARNAFLPALALECLHTYSLIHDDLPAMDNAPLRRGHSTLHKTYDEAVATLVGDGLNTYAFYLLSIARLDADVRIHLIKELAENGGINGMIIGQAMDCYFEKHSLEILALETIHIHKTAKLIATALKMGAIIANASAQVQDVLYEFGLKLGLFFQIRDDIIDATLTTNEAGKTTHKDSGKNSYVNLLGVQGAKEKAKGLQELILSELKNLENDLGEKLRILLKGYFQ